MIFCTTLIQLYQFFFFKFTVEYLRHTYRKTNIMVDHKKIKKRKKEKKKEGS